MGYSYDKARGTSAAIRPLLCTSHSKQRLAEAYQLQEVEILYTLLQLILQDDLPNICLGDHLANHQLKSAAIIF